MRIVFDARSYFMRTGIARYTRGLAHVLAVTPGPHDWLFLISDQHQADELFLESAAIEVRQSHAPWLGGRAEREVLAREVEGWSADIFHSVFPPHALERVPTLTTVFDFSPLSHPYLHQEIVREAFLEAWTNSVGHARGFATVSNATRNRLLERTAAKPVWMIPCGLSAPFDVSLSAEESASHRAGLLYVGTIEPRKNVALLLDAMRLLASVGSPVPLTLVGKRGWGYPEFEADLARTPGATWLGYVEDDVLLASYRRAAIGAFPSELEGFGLPVLEAMAQGVLPLVGSDPALAELIGRSDLRVPLDAAVWARTIRRWLDDETARSAAVRELTKRARAYSWSSVAGQFVDVYESFL